MKLHLFYVYLVFVLFCLLGQSCSQKAQIKKEQFNSIISNFQTPKEDNTIWCYWYWINDDISKEGITKDLEAMKKAGIGAALIGNINPVGVDGKVPLFSDEWWECMVHAVTEGHRIGVDIGVFNCPGWSQSGGPWVKSEMAMRYLTFSETQIFGSGIINVQLEKPANEFQDTHTLAFKTADIATPKIGEMVTKVVTYPFVKNAHKLLDNNPDTSIEFDVKKDSILRFELSLKNEITARQFSIKPASQVKCRCKLFANVDNEILLISDFVFDRSNLAEKVGPIVMGELAISFPRVVSDKFILECSDFVGRQSLVGFSELKISELPVLEHFVEKQLGKMDPTPTPTWYSYQWDDQDELTDKKLAITEVLDISDCLGDNGLLTWDVPEGRWTVMRMGMTPTGTTNHPTAPHGLGYEIDKMSKELVQVHFEKFIGELLKRIPEESKSAFKYVIADSYETGSQNWTDGFEIKFQEKFGYNPVKYLPVLSGRIVGSVEESERFLWDLRRAVADDVAYQYVGGLREISNKNNLQTWLENYGHWGFPSEFMMYGGQSDLIAGEFWNEGVLGNIECKASSSTSHTYGKGRTSAEAFTAANQTYLRHPANLKKRGDWSYTEGINHFILHLYIHQPDDKRIPGMNAWFSTEFNRHNTWFTQAEHYFGYLRRNQHLLQQGKYVADVCYFIGENTPVMTGVREPEIPKGYSYDYINAEVILNRLSVQNGRFVLPDGMSYRVMVLPPLKTMRPELLQKIEELVAKGGIILGTKPEKSPSLENYPKCDELVNELTAKLWNGAYSGQKLQNSYGQGKVFDGYSLEELFERTGIEKDFDINDDRVLFTHRSMPGMEIYFISNQSSDEIEIEPSFRVEGLKPQLWDAVTGEIRHINEFSIVNGRTVVPLKLEGLRSWYVVFTNADSDAFIPARKSNFPDAELLMEIKGPYRIEFKNKDIGPKEQQILEKLEDWSVSENEKIKYYSGSAVYTNKFKLDSIPEDKSLYINLGNVSVMAEVKINGNNVGGTWIAPYRLNISDYVTQGENQLEIEVVNLWRNQLIKDKKLTKEESYTWLVVDDIKEDEQPRKSGLLGPVQIECF